MEKTDGREGILRNAPSSIQRGFRNHAWDWPAAALTIVLLQIASVRLVMTGWTPLLYFTQTISFLGTLVGLAMGYSLFERRTITRLTLGYSLILLPAHWLNAIDRTDLLWKDLLTLAGRQFTSLVQFIRNQPVYDPLFFVSIASIGFWLISIGAGYQLARRRNFLNVVLPAGLVMLTVQVFDSFNSLLVWWLGIYLFIALLLLGRLFLLENQINWRKTRAHVTPESSRDLSNFVFFAALISIVAAWSLPGLLSGIQPAARAWEQVTRPIFDRLSDATSALDSEYGSGAGGELYGTEILLGQRASTGDTPVFYVQLDESGFVPLRFYWRGRNYGLYINGRWTNASTSAREFFPGTDERPLDFPDSRIDMQFTFINKVDSQSLMYSPAETIWVSRRSTMVNLTASGSVQDISAWLATPGLADGDKYVVRALISDPTVGELQNAGTDYPDWVLSQYLQVPENVRPQLLALAEEITAPYSTAYDKTAAITSYLREEIEYEAELTRMPPENMDPLLWVLFDYRKGFCMYSASAEVLMLRSIGIPARFAVGFVEGAFDEFDQTYTVSQMNAHAWPEVYFPGIGWVEFEPTGNQSPLDRPASPFVASAEDGPSQNPGNNNIPNLMERFLPENGNNSSITFNTNLNSGMKSINYAVVYIWTVLLAVTLTGLVFFIRRHSGTGQLPLYLTGRFLQGGNTPPRWLENWTRWAGLSEVERSFQAINLSLFWLGHPQPRHATPNERAEILINYLPVARDEITALASQYQIEVYTPRAAQAKLARNAALRILVRTWQSRIRDALEMLNRRYNQLR